MRFPFTRSLAAPQVPVSGNVLTMEQAERLLERAADAAAEKAVRGMERAFFSPSSQPAGPKTSLDPMVALTQKGPPGNPNATPQGIYAFDKPWQYAIPQAPSRHPGSLVNVETLRRVADTYDVLRSCIQHLKREVDAVPIQITPRDSKDDTPATKKRVEAAQAFFDPKGGLGGVGRLRSEFEGMVIEDLCVIGAAAIHYLPTLGGDVYEVNAIDSATIRPRVDAYGWPGPGEAWFEQWITGLKVREYTREELSYLGLSVNARSYSPYYASPVEWLLGVTTSALKADDWNRSWLTDGNVSTLYIGAPQEWTPSQIREYSDYIDAIMAGDNVARQKAKIVPSGTTFPYNQSRKDQDFAVFELWLLRRCCSIFGVQPASIGYSGEQYKVSQQDSMESTSAFGVGPILGFRKTVYDDVLDRVGFGDLECQNVIAREEDAKERAERNVILVAGGIKKLNEARQDEGCDPVEGGDVILVSTTLRPLAQALEPPPVPVAPGQTPPGKPGGNPKVAPGKTSEKDAGAQRVALGLWERKALNRLKAGKPAACLFDTDDLDELEHRIVGNALSDCETAEDVRAFFRMACGDLSRADDGDGHWVTIDGAHVFINGEGEITKGPAGLVGKQTGGDLDENAKLKASKPGGDHEQAIDAHANHLARDPQSKKQFSGKNTIVRKTTVAAVSEELFGHDLTDEEIAGVTGALGGSHINVRSFGSDGISIDVSHALGNPSYNNNFTIEKVDGELTMSIDYMGLKKSAPDGTGTRMFARQEKTASELGIKTLTLNAAREVNAEAGYYVWPRFGFDAPIPNKTGIPASLEGATNMSEVMATDEGRSWWKKNGVALDCTFDLAPDSLSSEVFAKYAKKNKIAC